jgi:hypothetical protein
MTPNRLVSSPTNRVLNAVRVERVRQDNLIAEGLPIDCTDRGVPLADKLAVLAEEFGEVARAVLEPEQNLYEELIQTAAVAVAWAESLA